MHAQKVDIAALRRSGRIVDLTKRSGGPASTTGLHGRSGGSPAGRPVEPRFNALGPTAWPEVIGPPPAVAPLLRPAPALLSNAPGQQALLAGAAIAKADADANLIDESIGFGPGSGTEPSFGEPAAKPQAVYWDPFSLVQQLGFRERPSGMAFHILRALAWRVPIVNAIIQTRVNQISAFASVQTHPAEVGFRVRMRNPEDRPTAADKKFINRMQEMILNCGGTSTTARDNFDLFIRKLARDSMTLDQGTWEIVPDAQGRPAAWYAVDAATIRRADNAKLYPDEDPDVTQYVQVYDGAVVAEFTAAELGFMIRNPRTDIHAFGYGTPEIEMLLQTITHILWGIEHNAAAFSQGTMVKGLLNIVGTMPPKNLRAFRRHFYQMVSGLGNSFRTPITNAEKLEWINLHVSNRDMEYSAWFDFLIKVACAMFAMNPIEVNFKYGNTAQRSVFEGAQRSMSQESKERGLRPILRTMSREFDRTIIWPHSDNFVMEFCGLEAMTPKELADLNTQRVRTMYTVNQMRIRNDEEPLGPEGDVILDANFINYKNYLAQKKLEAERAAATVQPGHTTGDDLQSMISQLSTPDELKGVTNEASGRAGQPHSTPVQSPANIANELEASVPPGDLFKSFQTISIQVR